MKKMLIAAALLLNLTACSSQPQEANIQKSVKRNNLKESVWNQLTGADKERIHGTWESANIHKVFLKECLPLHWKGRHTPMPVKKFMPLISQREVAT
ncbi:hypothetical protein LCM10_03630 [Rossellomorea aquimaris]|uniref:hypothetical protein n=1 Tax=Rossellomorea aquimaris TaxID=189382 RepID=UPI001CD1E0A2|nr:hypothetical protein [Rossellomorea aquimaris]MCA1054067.1 hypothetical protein [Rossellomorea aquimaris]